MEAAHDSHLREAIETILFISEKPVTLEQFREVVGLTNMGEIREVISHLQKEYAERRSGISIMEIAGGFQMLTNPDYALYVKRFYHSRHKERLSKPALETLAIIAYKQPVARMDIELIRGVNSDGVIDHLLEKGLAKITGRKDVPGRPYLYGTTREFLEYFGLKSLGDLPKLEDFASLEPVALAADTEKQLPQDKATTEESNEPQGTTQ